MKRITCIITLFILTLPALSILIARDSKVDMQAELKTPVKSSFFAGNEIILSFASKTEILPKLFIRNSYGSTVLNAEKKDDLLQYKFPKPFSDKAGELNWILILNREKILTGSIEILPDNKAETVLENYFGPRQIQAGNNDFSMLVTVPTDEYDNPLPANTSVFIHQQFLNDIRTSEQKTQFLMAWQNIYSRRKTGIVAVSSSCNNTNSKELITEIYPSNAVNFEIGFTRNHEFADGNQQIEFTSSGIKDEYGNVVSDGTLVEFLVTNSKGYKLKTFGETINGIAKAKMLHPDFPDIWKVKAFVTGLAESNELTIPYKSALTDFNVEFKNGNREIVVGPLLSFMKQRIQDGIKVNLEIYTSGKKVEAKTGYSSDGLVTFYLKPEFYKNGIYNFRVEALGISKYYNEQVLNEATQ